MTDAEPPVNVDALVSRSIAFTHTGDAERPFTANVADATLLVQVNDFPAEPLYSVYADGVHLADLEDWPAVWIRPGVPAALRDLAARTPRGAALVAATSPLDAAALHAWAATLCAVSAADSETVLRALRFDGPLVEAVGYRRLASPPAQTAHTDVGESAGKLVTLRFEPGGVRVTRGELDAELGDGTELAPAAGSAAHQVRYPVAVDGAPFTCDVIASFLEQPTPVAVAREFTLRRLRAVTI